MALTTYRIDFPTPHGPCPEPLTVIAHRFDTMGNAVFYHLKKHLDAAPVGARTNLERDANSRVTGGTGTVYAASGSGGDAPVIAEFTFTSGPGPADPEVGANAELAGTTHCPICGSPEWNPVDVECEDCAAEVERFDGLLDILEEFDVHVVDEVDDNPERNPRLGFVPFDSTDLPERILAWRDAAVQAAVAVAQQDMESLRAELEDTAKFRRHYQNGAGLLAAKRDLTEEVIAACEAGDVSAELAVVQIKAVFATGPVLTFDQLPQAVEG